MPSHSDIYVICDKRDLDSILGFLNEFLPHREESADDYAFPQFADIPDVIYCRAVEALEKCIAEPGLEYSIYWCALEKAKPEHAMIFFLKDGYVIYGLSTDDAYPEYAEELLKRMKSFLNSSLGYIGWEAPPDASCLEEFKREIEQDIIEKLDLMSGTKCQ